MDIPKNKLKMWVSLREPKDIPELMNLTGFSQSKVYDIFKSGKCDQDTAVLIDGFYLDKKEKREEFIKGKKSAA